MSSHIKYGVKVVTAMESTLSDVERAIEAEINAYLKPRAWIDHNGALLHTFTISITPLQPNWYLATAIIAGPETTLDHD